MAGMQKTVKHYNLRRNKKMKTRAYILSFILVLATVFSSIAQPHGDRVRALRIAYITDKIHLSSQQSEQFWPLYNRYQDEIRAIRRDDRIEDDIAMSEAILDVKKKYKVEFLKVISQEQLTALYKAEREFKAMLIKRLEEGGGPQRRPMRK